MTDLAPTQQQIAAWHHVLSAFFELIEWCYELFTTSNQRHAVQQVIVARWADPDRSVRELMCYLTALHSRVFQEPQHTRAALRPAVVEVFQGLFTRLEPNGRGQVLGALYRLLETLSPGCTRVGFPTPSVSASSSPCTPPPFDSLNVVNASPFSQQSILQEQVRQYEWMLEEGLWNMSSASVLKIVRS